MYNSCDTQGIGNMKTKTTYVSEERAKEIAARLTQAREKLGWSQSEMSRGVEATRGACSHWESGNAHKMTLENAMRLCSQLGISLDYLTTGKKGAGVVDKECLYKSIAVAERLAPRATVEQKTKLVDITYAMCSEGQEIPDSVILRLVSLENR